MDVGLAIITPIMSSVDPSKEMDVSKSQSPRSYSWQRRAGKI